MMKPGLAGQGGESSLRTLGAAAVRSKAGLGVKGEERAPGAGRSSSSPHELGQSSGGHAAETRCHQVPPAHSPRPLLGESLSLGGGKRATAGD